jgi:ATP-dependent Lhr-like helicase
MSRHCWQRMSAEAGAEAAIEAGIDSGVEDWFAARGWQVLAFQRAAWEASLAGRSGLIHAPTGSGKTLAAWLGPVQALQRAHPQGLPPGLRVLWITPLRALAADTQRSLEQALSGLALPWKVELRSGDTSQAVRTRQWRKPPAALVTTPESLSVMLATAGAADWFAGLHTVVVDEWHELLGSKRGVQLQLCLARLRGLVPGLRTWGVSATLGNLEQAREVLLGPGVGGELIHGALPRPVLIEALLPAAPERFPWAGHLGASQLQPVIDALAGATTTLLFTNTRSQAERWHAQLLAARPDWQDTLALHHGSLDRGLREQIEARLRTGELRCVVCTSSLDLGVDFQPVEQVLQVGSPKGVARLLQRAGRSGHRPGQASRVLCVPTHVFELVEIAAARRAAGAGEIEARVPPTLCLDVLIQHAVTLATGEGFQPDALYEEVRGTHAFAALTRAQWDWIIDFITRGGRALSAYPQFCKVQIDADGIARVGDARIARLHRMAIGTISSDAMMQVRWLRGGRLGSVEESFLSRLSPGDSFLFAGRVVELVRVRDMVAWVRVARAATRIVPRWQGGRMPLSTQLADSVLALLGDIDRGIAQVPELTTLAPMLELQSRWSRLPAPDVLLLEQLQTREGHHLFIYPFAGRLVHDGLAALLAWRLMRLAPATFTLSANDYGLELLSPAPIVLPAVVSDLWSEAQLLEDLLACINASEIARRQFRDIARISGLVFQGYPGAQKTTRQIQASSGLMFDVLSRHDEGNLLIEQARREVLESQLEYFRLRQTLQRMRCSELCLMQPARLTPLSFPLWAERLHSQVMSSEDWHTRVLRMAQRLERAADGLRPAAMVAAVAVQDE